MPKIVQMLIFSVTLAGGLATGQANETGVIRLSEPVVQTTSHETFGAALPRDIEPVTLSQAVAKLANLAEPDQGQDAVVVIETEIAEVCQKKGCFFIARDGETVARVTFKDYAFFIPTDAASKQVTLAGSLSQKVLSQAQAAHYAQDVGRSGESAQGGVEYAIVATGVSVPR